MNHKRTLPLLLAAGGLALVVVQIAGATHPRPKSAGAVRTSLVVAYEQCTAPNTTHGPPLALPSCSPPVQTSDYLTVGTPDANGAAANSVGSVRVWVTFHPGPPDDSHVKIEASITDVRCKPGVNTCGNANTAGGPDFTGELSGQLTVRLTDDYNGPNANQAGTLADLPQPFTLFCGSTADPSIGATCKTVEVFCSSCPPPKEGVRMNAELTQVRIMDGGADGRGTPEDNTLFMVQGVLLP